MKKQSAIVSCVLLLTACGSNSTDSVPGAVQREPSANEAAVIVDVPAASNNGGATASDRTAAQPVAPTTTTAADRQFTFSGTIVTTLTNDVHTASVELAVIDEKGQPAANVEVHGHFTEGLKDVVVSTTDSRGIAVATAASGKQHLRVGFKVTAVTYVKDGERLPGKVLVDLIYPSPCCPVKSAPTQ